MFVFLPQTKNVHVIFSSALAKNSAIRSFFIFVFYVDVGFSWFGFRVRAVRGELRTSVECALSAGGTLGRSARCPRVPVTSAGAVSNPGFEDTKSAGAPGGEG